MHRTGALVVALAVFLALMGAPSPLAAANLPGWSAQGSGWTWLVDLIHLRGEEGSFIDQNGRVLQAPPRNGYTHLRRGKQGGYIDPNGRPQNASSSGEAGGFIDPNGI